MRGRLSALAALGLLGGCMSLPPESTVGCEEATRPAIRHSADGKTAYAEIDILTYNIEGLPWPARSGRGPYLEQIGERLAAFRSAGEGPDIVLFQEVFSNSASRAVQATGYRSVTSGPSARSRQAPNTQGSLPGNRQILRGEIRPNFLSSGLAIATDYPMVSTAYVPFARGSCAGFDCLSNKGVLFAELAIPGIPGTVDVFTTHMNAQGATGVSVERHAPAHARQTAELAEFVQTKGQLSNAMVVAGDFNMRNSDVRFYTFSRKVPLENVHRYCSENPTACDVRQEWPHDDQWRRVQNLHLFTSGDTVKVRPIRVEGMFDGGPSGPVLSDHNGFRVVYEFSWPVQQEGTPPPVCPWALGSALGR
jgi:endonuclease/exonuclease/phosphatase family metal-dependent hydrolase